MTKPSLSPSSFPFLLRQDSEMSAKHIDPSIDLCLPYVSLQPDYAQVYTDISQGLNTLERAWVSVYCGNAPSASIHAKLLLTRNEGPKGEVDVQLEDKYINQLEIQRFGDNPMDFCIASTSREGSLLANTTKSAISLPETYIRTPKRTLGPLVKGSIGVSAFDISPVANNLYVVGGADGQAHIGMLGDPVSSNGQGSLSLEDADIEEVAQHRIQARLNQRQAVQRTYLKGHVGDVRSAKFFPSGEVVLTTSSDCTARVFGVDGENPRTLTGHRRAIVDSAFIERGKRVLTASMDGTTRLWDVSQGVQLSSFDSQSFSGVNKVNLGSVSSTSNLFVTGLSNGIVEAFDLSSKNVVFRIGKSQFPSGPAPKASDSWKQFGTEGVEAMDWCRESHSLIIGYSNGVTLLHDMRMLSNAEQRSTDEKDTLAHPSKSLLSSWQRNGAAINDVQLLKSGKEAIFATADGTPYRLSLTTSTPQVIEEYNGWDVDNVQVCRFDHAKSRVWLAGAEGMVRMY